MFAIGDVTGRYPLVHVAIQQGEIAARNAIRGTRDAIDYSLSKAHTIFSDPQVAVTGETEGELAAANRQYLKATYLFSDHGKAISIGKTKGFVKMLADPEDGCILGVQILGPEASDLIHEAIAAMHFHATVFDFVRIPHLHPTLAEILTYPAEELVVRIEARAWRPSAAIFRLRRPFREDCNRSDKAAKGDRDANVRDRSTRSSSCTRIRRISSRCRRPR